MYLLLLLLAIGNSEFVTRLRLNSEAIDRLACPIIAKALANRLRATVFAWNSAVDDDVSKVKIGLPPKSVACRSYLLPSEDAVEMILSWSLLEGTDDHLEAVIRLAWRNGIEATCNATIGANLKTRAFVDQEQAKESACKEVERYFSELPSIVVYPLWTDLDLLYALKSMIIDSDHVEIHLDTSIGPLTSGSVPQSVPMMSQNSDKMVQIVFDQQLINAIFDRLYEKYGDTPYQITADDNDMKIDCGMENGPTEQAACLGSLMKSINRDDTNEGVKIDISVKSSPRITVVDGTAVLRTNGELEIRNGDNNGTLAKANFRLVARLAAEDREDKRVIGSTSIDDIALMLSDIETIDKTASNETFSNTTKLMTKLIAPILITSINKDLGVGLPLPLPQKAKIHEMHFLLQDGAFEATSDLGEI